MTSVSQTLFTFSDLKTRYVWYNLRLKLKKVSFLNTQTGAELSNLKKHKQKQNIENFESLNGCLEKKSEDAPRQPK